MKMVIVLRKDLNMRKGKMVAQGCHAVMDIMIGLRSFKNVEECDAYTKWLREGATKIVVGVPDEEMLIHVHRMAEALELPCSIITDAGRTEFGGVPTKTAVAIGPGKDETIDMITGELPLL